MPKKISWSLNLQVADGPKFSANNEMEVQGYDVIDVAVPSGNQPVTVNLLPAGGKVHLVLLKTDHKNLSFTVNGGQTSRKVDTPAVFLSGAEAAKLLDADLKTLEFKNADPQAPATSAGVQVLVGRNFTP